MGRSILQLSNAYELRVIRSASSPAILELLWSLGADVVLDHHQEDVVAQVWKAAGGKRAVIVYDACKPPAVCCCGERRLRVDVSGSAKKSTNKTPQLYALSRGTVTQLIDEMWPAHTLLLATARCIAQVHAYGHLTVSM